jgi:hypothetical protein
MVWASLTPLPPLHKTHDRDPILFNDGLSLVFRNMEDTTGCGNVSHCPNQYCAPGAASHGRHCHFDRK